MHIIALGKAWYDQAELTRDWQKATRGEGQIVDIRRVSKADLRRALKYCFKAPDLSNWTVNEVRQFQALRRTKLSECFGELRGVKVTEDELSDFPVAEPQLFVGCPCPECGARLQIRNVSWRELEGDDSTPVGRNCFLRVRAGPELVH